MNGLVFASDFHVKKLLLYKAFQVKSLTFKFITDPNEEMYMWAAQQQNESSETCQHLEFSFFHQLMYKIHRDSKTTREK